MHPRKGHETNHGALAYSRPSLLLEMTRALRYFAAGLAALGAAGRGGSVLTIPVFGMADEPRVRPRTDSEAIASDWAAVARDFEVAAGQLREEHPELADAS